MTAARHLGKTLLPGGGVIRGLPGVILVLSSLMALSPAANAETPAPAHRPTALRTTPPPGTIPDQYIITLRPGTSASAVVIPLGLRPLFVFTTVLNGFAAHLTPDQLSAVRRHPDVLAIEQDAVVRAFDLPAGPGPGETGGPPTPVPPTWGLDRIDQRTPQLNGKFAVHHDGAGVTAYIIDTGIDQANSQFAGRIADGRNFIADGHGTNDCQGHGTMVAGIVGGTTWGVARKVRLAPIRVLGCDGSGSFAAMIAGFDWVATHAARPAVANVALGGPLSDAANAAVNALSAAKIYVSAAAGNSSSDACYSSPGGAPGPLTVAASTTEDTLAPFSNFGPCVDLIAPGVQVGTTKLGGGTSLGTGTSFSASFATGVGALYKQAFGDADSYAIHDWSTSNATDNAVGALSVGTHNRLLYTGGL